MISRTSDRSLHDASGCSAGISRRRFLGIGAACGFGLAATAFLRPVSDVRAAGSIHTRFLVGSDVHIPVEGSEAKFAAALKWAKTKLSPEPDAICLVGDITDSSSQSYYDRAKAVIDRSPYGKDRDRLVLCQGNHEMLGIDPAKAGALFKQNWGQEPDKLVSVAGVPIITMGPTTSTTSYYGSHYTFLKESLETIGSDTRTFRAGAPILVLCHHAIDGTVYVSPEWHGNYVDGDRRDLVELMKAHPQIIHISGHSHATIEDARSIDQSLGFTCIQDSTLGAYFENEKTKPHTMYDPTTGEVNSYPPFRDEASQCIVLDVMENGTVQVTRYSLCDLASEGRASQVFETWSIDIPGLIARGRDPKPDALPYVPSRASHAAPMLPSDTEVAITDPTPTSLTIGFASFTAGSTANVDMIHDYRLELTPVKGGDTLTRRVFNDYYRSEAKRHEREGKRWSVLVSGLAPETTYQVRIYAETSFPENGTAGVSAALIASETGTTAQEPPAPDRILDVDFRTGRMDDAAGHHLTRFGAAMVVDETLVAGASTQVLEIDGNGGCRYDLNEEDYPSITSHHSAECLFKMVDVQSDQCLFSNQKNAGAGMEVQKGQLQYWLNLDSVKMPAAEIRADAWIHAVATFDGKIASLYLDGELKNTWNAAGSMKIPAPKGYFVGANCSRNNEPEFLCKKGTRVAIARLHTRCLTPEEVKQAYADSRTVTKSARDEKTGVTADGLSIDQDLVVADTSAATRHEPAKDEVLIASFDITLKRASEQPVQPDRALTITMPVSAGWSGATATVFVFHSDGSTEQRTVTVDDRDAVVLSSVRRLSEFDVVAHKTPLPDGGGSKSDTDKKLPSTGESSVLKAVLTGAAGAAALAAAAGSRPADRSDGR